MTLAPIVLFVYNRPWHTRQTLEALAINHLADQSHLIIYADGPKELASADDLKKIQEVRAIIRKKKWCKTVEIIESNINYGLANSIINGVTTVVNDYGKIIVLEDDLVTSPWFLTFLNDGLEIYENEVDVISIHGYMYPLKKRLPNPFFIKGADCWGWATWKRGWDLFEEDGNKLLKEIRNKNLSEIFDYNGLRNHTEMLIDQINKKNNSWAIRWHASALVKGKVTLYPQKTLVKNIGNDYSGTHCTRLNIVETKLSNKKLPIIKLKIITENIIIRQFMIDFFQSVKENGEYLEKKSNIKVMFKIIKKPLILIFNYLYYKYKRFEMDLEIKKRISKFIKTHGIEYTEITPYLFINGWLYEKQAITLYELPQKITHSQIPICVEIGSWQGKSAFLIAKGLKKKFSKSQLFCVDPFNADGDDSETEKKVYESLEKQIKQTTSLFEIFSNNMKRLEVNDIITPLKGLSFDVFKSFNHKIDLIFIDGNHSYEGVKRDFLEWSTLINSGGYIIFHDVDYNPAEEPNGTEEHLGPALVIKEFILFSNEWINKVYDEGLYYAQKQ